MATNTREISVDAWIEIPENPRQRDTARRAEYARKRHLRVYEDIHRFVIAATINGEIVVKLDGHARSRLWEHNKLNRPPSGRVVVQCHEVENLEEAKQLYDKIDAQQAMKRSCDIFYSAAHEHGLIMESTLLKNCQFLWQLKKIEGTDLQNDVYALVGKWCPYLRELDLCHLTDKYKVLIGFMLVTIRHDGEPACGQFFRDLDTNQGIKDERGCDGVEALHGFMGERKAAKLISGYDNWNVINEIAWTCYLLWRGSKRIRNIKNLKPNKEFAAIVSEDAKREKFPNRAVQINMFSSPRP